VANQQDFLATAQSATSRFNKTLSDIKEATARDKAEANVLTSAKTLSEDKAGAIVSKYEK
jgi:hypothetical protein